MSPKDTLKSALRFSLLLFAGLTTMSSTGCVISQGGSVAETEAQIPVDNTDTTTAETYRVEMSGGFSNVEFYEGQIDGPMFVQDALERSGATERYRAMDILVYRVVKESGRGLKLPVEYESGGKMVMQNQNYALHPNDRIVVTNRSLNAIDKIIDSLNPLD
ncbi:hypothetical protein N9B31_06815 [Mariniblastus sp.]|jgi:hypothetical protein|nr:hypothetical protein [Mariniblastus sp.]MDC3224341.1 hypothetical protein [Mariniblastus sp.]